MCCEGVRDHKLEVDESSSCVSSYAKRGVLVNGIPEISTFSVPMCGSGEMIPFVLMGHYIATGVWIFSPLKLARVAHTPF